MKATIIIPCYNEAARLDLCRFETFLDAHTEVSFCFVDDGSTDSTNKVIASLVAHPRISALFLQCNSGKAEAVRTAVCSVLTKDAPDVIGYWDADLATPLDEIPCFMEEMTRSSDIEAVVGTRLPRLGASIERTASREFTGNIMHMLIRRYLRLPIFDSQCGAKMFRASLAQRLFAEPFTTRWLFDVELFRRMGVDFARKHVCELPLREWHEIDGSKFDKRASIKIFGEFFRIIRHYG